MANAKTVLSALVLAAWTASPVLAEDITPVDVKGVTCGDFMAMDTPGKNDVSYHVLQWIGDQNNAVEAQKLIEKYHSASAGTWAPEKLTVEIEGHCKDGSADEGIIARLIEHT